MSTTDSRLAFTPGTRVRVSQYGLPTPDAQSGSLVRTLLDPADYTLPSGDSLPDHHAGSLLVATPHGWDAKVAPGRIDAGAAVNLWWVQASACTVEQPAPVTEDDVLTAAEREMLAGFVLSNSVDDLLDACRAERRQFLAAVQQREEQARRADEARTALAREQEKQAAWAEQVRDLIVEKGRQQGACDDGIARALASLGLSMPTREWEVEVEVVLTATRTVTVTVEATSEDDARKQVDDDEVASAVELEGVAEWEVESWDAGEVNAT